MLMNAQSWDGGAQRDMARPESMLLLYFPERFDLRMAYALQHARYPIGKEQESLPWTEYVLRYLRHETWFLIDSCWEHPCPGL